MKYKFSGLLFGLFLCLALTSPALAAEENTVTVTVSELTPGYYVGAVWDGDTLLTLFDAEVGSDGILNKKVELGDTPLSGDTVQVGISSANAGGKPIAPIVCPVNSSSSEPSKPTEPAKPDKRLYTIYIPNVTGGTVTASTRSSYAGTYIPLTVAPNRGYELRSIFLTDSTGNRISVSYSGGQYWFLMPSSNVTVYADFMPTASNTAPVTSTTTSKPQSTATPRPNTSPMAISVFASKTGHVGRVRYSIDYALSATVTGGTGSYSYQFEIKQNGRLTRSSDWTANPVFSGYIAGTGSCVAEIKVKDSSGQIAKTEVDILTGTAITPTVTISAPSRPANSSASSTPSGTPNQPATSTPAPEPNALTIGTSLSKSSSIVGSTYSIRFTLSANATGGNGGYTYQFKILQNGEATKSTGWTSGNTISESVSGTGACVVEISARDSSGNTASTVVDLLESSSVKPSIPNRPSTPSVPSNPTLTPDTVSHPLTIGTSISKASAVIGSISMNTVEIAAYGEGGNGNYQYKFEIVQSGRVIQSLGWSYKNAISIDLSELSRIGPCMVEITVKDSSGETASTTVNL